jgi:transcriptional regulatory protein LevR
VDALIAHASKTASAMKSVAEKMMQRAKSEPVDSPTKPALEAQAKAKQKQQQNKENNYFV